jgi:hypothetical protein
MACAARAACHLRAHLYGFIFFNRAGMGLTRADAELSQHVKNLATLDF